MIPAALMDEVMTIFTTKSEEDNALLRSQLGEILDPWWDAMLAMIIVVAEEGLPNAETYEL